MKQEIDVPAYSLEHGIRTEWEQGFEIDARIAHNTVVIRANPAGLVSLARHLLTLAQATVPTGRHIHLDDSNALEDGSCELVFERME